MPAQRIYGIVSKAGVMAKTVTMTVEKNMVHPKLLKVSRASRTNGTLLVPPSAH